MSRRNKRIPPFETEISHLGPKGVGMGVAPDGKPVAVRRAPPGSRVRVRPAGRRKGQWKGVRTHLVRPAPDHVDAPCSLFGLCGGCVLQEIPLERQRSLKQTRGEEDVGPATWASLRGDTEAYGYRNKMEFSFGTARYLDEQAHAAGVPIDGRFIGMHAAGRFDRVVDTERCLLMDDGLNAILSTVRELALVDGAPMPWNPRAHEGFLRHLQLRRGSEGALLALFTTTPDAEQRAFVESLATRLLENPDVLGLSWFLNDKVADVAQGTLEQTWGRDTLPMALLGKTFELAPLAFFQTNTRGAEVLYETIGEALGTGHRLLLDLYCGTGSIGICLADHAEEVVGIEVVADAIDNARINAERNGVDARYRVAKVEDALEELTGGPGVSAIVDPPRVGLHPKVAKVLADAKLDVLVYVACNPASLGRDREVLEAGGWVLERCWAVDLFPQTGHLEVVGRFVRP